jgi:hypothetical protein
MNRVWGKMLVAVFGISALAIFVLAEQQPQDVLGKITFASLFDAAPAIPASTAEAGKRVYGADLAANPNEADLTPFYEPFNKRVAAARNVIQGAVDARPANQGAMATRATAEADNSAIIARMGGTEKISQMSEEEVQAAAMKAAGDYQQSMAGGHQETSNGMQVIMQRVMNDPEYRERFEKMTPEQQKAEMRKAMGPGAPVAQHTAAEEKRAMQAPNEMAARVARQNEIGTLLQRMVEIDTEFEKKDKAIASSPGNHNQIDAETKAKIAKLPIVHIPGEASYDGPDPAKLKVVLREQAALDRTRAAAELQQRTALFAERKAKYKELAASYASWLKQAPGAASNSSANFVNDASADTALRCEEELIGRAESLRKYHEGATRDAAYYEQLYQKKLTEM